MVLAFTVKEFLVQVVSVELAHMAAAVEVDLEDVREFQVILFQSVGV